MTLTVLTDDQIRSVLENLTPGELNGFRDALVSALREYSASSGKIPDEPTSVHQPERISVHSAATGATTLFMPSCNSAGHGVKVVSLTSASTTTQPAGAPAKPTIRPTGAITLFTPHGSPLGILHASSLTAFRTALASLTLIQQRVPPSATGLRLVLFGCGEQAYWHARLTLLACSSGPGGPGVESVVFVNRRESPACGEIRARFGKLKEQGSGDGGGSGQSVAEREGWGGCVVSVLTPEVEGGEYKGKWEGALREADVVVCCTPSTRALFDTAVLDGDKRKGKLVVAIGSYTPEMRELPAELVERSLGKGDGDGESGVIVVDTREGALKEAGELIAAGAQPEQLIELGEIATLASEDNTMAGSGDHGLSQRLQKGNVIYKSVGLGLMDLSVGLHIVEFAKQKGIGTHVQGF
ncbi:Delta(1)-pyrroline-2-carboxylate reductase [Dichotomopilus funicola]|uniref:Delta(1)-pyrroline-2-carboxylate reductase n=1 Tax=Dichotomopilus funicola TaxID=1934379 RepID=A0AAN6V5Q3_9PEZI|nr:Delta(1)-pyrroline-2-carboxylate reductase [Dichotomopilus funicola]